MMVVLDSSTISFKTYIVILLNDGTSWTMRVKQAIPNFKTVRVLHSVLAGLRHEFME